MGERCTFGLEVGRAVEAQDRRRRLLSDLRARPRGRHGQVAAGGPPDGEHLGRVHGDAARACDGGQLVPDPGQGVADVGDGARDQVDLGAEAVVDADGEVAVVEEELGLVGTDGAAREGHVAAAVDHEGCDEPPVSVSAQTGTFNARRKGKGGHSLPMGMGPAAVGFSGK